jgi:hypothetical protein
MRGGNPQKDLCGLCGHFSGELKMNLLEKYMVLAITDEREKVKKGFIGESPAKSAQSHSVGKAEGNKGIAAAPLEMKVVWENPFPKGTPEARAESLRVVESARGGELI